MVMKWQHSFVWISSQGDTIEGKCPHTLASLEFLFTNGGNEVHTHTEPSVLASCVCTSRLDGGVNVIRTKFHDKKKKTKLQLLNSF